MGGKRSAGQAWKTAFQSAKPAKHQHGQFEGPDQFKPSKSSKPHELILFYTEVMSNA